MDQEHNIIINNPTSPFAKYDIDYIIVNDILRNTLKVNKSDIISNEIPHIKINIIAK